jgi:hypothetical protein
LLPAALPPSPLCHPSASLVQIFQFLSHDTALHRSTAYHIKSHHSYHYYLQFGFSFLLSCCLVDQHLKDATVHGQLVKSGRAWADHINEPWNILVCVGAYIIFSVGFDITICALLGDAVLAIGQSNTTTYMHTHTLTLSDTHTKPSEHIA